MSPAPRKNRGSTARLDRDRVLRTAVAVADAGGLGSLTIRSLAQELGVTPMSVYHYVAGKEEILDGIVDLVFAEIDLPTVGADWRPEMVRRAHSARGVLRRHSWAIPLLESRTSPGPATLAHHDAVLGVLRGAGFSRALAAHAYALIDAFVYGYAVQESSLPFDGGIGEDVAGPIMELMARGDYPHLVDMATSYYTRPDYDFGEEFAFGLDLILDSLAARLTAEGQPTGP